MVACETRPSESWTWSFRPLAVVVRACLTELQRCAARIDSLTVHCPVDEGMGEQLGRIRAAIRGLLVFLLRLDLAAAPASGADRTALTQRALSVERGTRFLRGYLEVALHHLRAGDRAVAMTLVDRAQACTADLGLLTLTLHTRGEARRAGHYRPPGRVAGARVATRVAATVRRGAPPSRMRRSDGRLASPLILV